MQRIYFKGQKNYNLKANKIYRKNKRISIWEISIEIRKN